MGEFKKALNVEYLKPGEIVKVDIGSTAVLIGNVDGEFYAVSNICPHSARPILEHKSSMHDNQVKCPHHGSIFDMATGDLVRGLATECLTKYAVRVDGGSVLVDVDAS
jgi:3-phenylpropionate/trans-cinnamate dioxygenase ferredoxin subunit